SAAEVVDATVERLPFPDATFDTVVVTFVLCSVPSRGAALAEIARVRKPSGRLLFLEHVRSDDEKLAKWQDRITPLYNLVGGHPHPDTPAAREGSEVGG